MPRNFKKDPPHRATEPRGFSLGTGPRQRSLFEMNLCNLGLQLQPRGKELWVHLVYRT